MNIYVCICIYVYMYIYVYIFEICSTSNTIAYRTSAPINRLAPFSRNERRQKAKEEYEAKLSGTAGTN
jgi:hypothetical protein